MSYKYGSYKNEYLITNVNGSYSSSNYLYGNTRKYHGLLIAGTGGLEKRNVLNRIEDTINIKNNSYPLSRSIFKNEAIIPPEYKYLNQFLFKPNPKWHFSLPGAEVIKTMSLEKHKNLVTITYRIKSNDIGVLRIKPFIGFRSIHQINSLPSHIGIEENLNGIKFKLDDYNFLFVTAPKVHFISKEEMYYDFFYPDEKERGYEHFENLLTPGFFDQVFLSGQTELSISFAFNEMPLKINIEKSVKSPKEPRLNSNKTFYGLEKLEETCLYQSAHFQISDVTDTGLVAGLHWFDEWSRDTFISLKGLCLTTNQLAFAKEVIETWSRHLETGLLPNRRSIKDKFNSLDSVFWFVLRAYEYTHISGDFNFIEKLLPKLENILIAMEKGVNKIVITKDGFLYDGNYKEAMTWMDTKIDEKPVIDRSGCAVEIQALWYNYIRVMINLKEKLNDRTFLTRLKELKVLIERNFEKFYWNKSTNCLYDVIRDEFKEGTIRPNQVIALYLPFNLIGNRRSKMILATLERKLLTPVGLQTLPKEDMNYHSLYTGNQKQRDEAYHQGTIWPFLLGFYLMAYLKTYHYSGPAKKYVYDKLKEFQDHLAKGELTYIPEVFSSESLMPGGCLSQAWSVATILETFYHLKSTANNNVN